MPDKPVVLIIGTLDTKLPEILYLRSSILSHGFCQTQVLDVSRKQEANEETRQILGHEILNPLQDSAEELGTLPRGDYTTKTITICTPVVAELVRNKKINGIISAAGSTGSSIATAIMRQACPVGFPKLMVSTMASGDIKPYIEETDITMMYSVVDIAGINSILEHILLNAAGAIHGMVVAQASKKSDVKSKGTRIAVTMFGVTTPCVDNVRKILTTPPNDAAEYEIYVFHATGSGGRAMERLIEEGQIDAVLDLTTTEIADELCGGVLAAGPYRLEAAVRKGIPIILSPGACDMVNFGPKESVPERYKNRNLFVHNPTVTLMRTTKEENRQIGDFIVKKLSAARDPSKIRVLLPTGGVSVIDQPNQPFYDPEADKELFEVIAGGLSGTSVEIFQYPTNINDEIFAAHVCEHFLEVMGVDPRANRLPNTRPRRFSFDHGKTIHAVRRASQIEIPNA